MFNHLSDYIIRKVICSRPVSGIVKVWIPRVGGWLPHVIPWAVPCHRMQNPLFMQTPEPLSYEQLRDAARDAVADSGLKQTDIADELGVAQSAISQAINEAGSRRAALQMRLVEHLTRFRVEERTQFYLIEKEA